MKKTLIATVVLCATLLFPAISAKAGDQPYVGEIVQVGFTFAPPGWAICDGRTLNISEYATLFNLIGTTYGGDGQTTFALPDLRGRCIVGAGGAFVVGQKAGVESETITANQMPPHTHVGGSAVGTVIASTATGDSIDPTGRVLAESVSGVSTVKAYVKPIGPININDATQVATNKIKPMAANTVSIDMTGVGMTVQASGGSQPIDIMKPFLTTNYIISLSGVFPSPN